MTKVLAGYHDLHRWVHRRARRRSGAGLGEGGERLHYWVFGGPWTYDTESKGEPTGADAAWLADTISRIGAVVGGRWTYEAARHWGDANPWGLPVFVVTHRPGGRAEWRRFHVRVRCERGCRASSAKPPAARIAHVMGGADVIRQALAAGLVDELTIIVAPVILGGGKRLFDGFAALAGPRAPRRQAIAVRDVHRLPGKELARRVTGSQQLVRDRPGAPLLYVSASEDLLTAEDQ